MSQRRILITGATGGLGMALVREAVSRGHKVIATGRSLATVKETERLGARFRPLDLADPKADIINLVSGCDSVIHAAALSSSWGSYESFKTMNVLVTQRLLEAAGHGRVRRFVLVSSPSIFAGFCDQFAIGERALPATKPLNHYARTKLAAERWVLTGCYAEMDCCAIRPRALVGPGDRVILPRLAELARRKRMPLPRGGKAMIELTDLRDAAWAICEAEDRAADLSGKAINVSGGRPVRVSEVAKQLAEALGENPRLVSLPMTLARTMASLLETFARLRRSEDEPILTRYTLATLGYSQTFDQEPAQRLLGYVPRYNALATLVAEARKMAAMENVL